MERILFRIYAKLFRNVLIMIEFEITDEYIELNKLLKVTRVVESGAMAKAVIEDELVIRNGEIETRKRAKIRKGEVIELWDQQIKVI